MKDTEGSELESRQEEAKELQEYRHNFDRQLKYWEKIFEAKDKEIAELRQQVIQLHAAIKERDEQYPNEIKELKEALYSVQVIAEYYHDRSITYTDRPFNTWNDLIDRAKQLLQWTSATSFLLVLQP